MINTEIDNPFSLTTAFMHKLVVGDTFSLNGKKYLIKSIGKTKGTNSYYKTVTINNGLNSFRVIYLGNNWFVGSMKSKDIRNKTDMYVNNLLRDVEGMIIVDFLNVKNIFHEFSDVLKISKR